MAVAVVSSGDQSTLTLTKLRRSGQSVSQSMLHAVAVTKTLGRRRRLTLLAGTTGRNYAASCASQLVQRL